MPYNLLVDVEIIFINMFLYFTPICILGRDKVISICNKIKILKL